MASAKKPVLNGCFTRRYVKTRIDVRRYIEHYNNVRLNRAVGYIPPKDMLAGRQQEIYAERDRKLEASRNQRRFVASMQLDESCSLGRRVR